MTEVLVVVVVVIIPAWVIENCRQARCNHAGDEDDAACQKKTESKAKFDSDSILECDVCM